MLEKTTRRFALALTAALVVAFAGGCGDDDDGGTTAPTGGTGNGGGTFLVTVGSGTNPTYSWDGGAAFTVSVVRTAAPSIPVWNITTPAVDGLAPPVTHGTVAAGALEVVAVETALTAGVSYTVSVVRLDGTLAFRDFTP